MASPPPGISTVLVAPSYDRAGMNDSREACLAPTHGQAATRKGTTGSP